MLCSASDVITSHFTYLCILPEGKDWVEQECLRGLIRVYSSKEEVMICKLAENGQL